MLRLFSATILIISITQVLFCENELNKSSLIEVSDYVHSPPEYISILVPADSEEYPLLSENPLLFFLFLSYNTEFGINALKVENIRDGYLICNNLRNYLLPLSNIKGFNVQLDWRDKFALAEKKKLIIDTLLGSYRTYNKEYQKYLNSIFVFPQTAPHPSVHSQGVQTLRGYEEYKGRLGTLNNFNSPYKYYIERNDYDVDNQTLRSGLFGLHPTTSTKQYDRWNWEQVYESIYYKKNDQRLPEFVSIPIPIEKAKQLFSGQSQPYETTWIVVKPLSNMLSTYGASMTNFKILQIKKSYFLTRGSNDELIYSYDINSTRTHPLYAKDEAMSDDYVSNLMKVSNKNPTPTRETEITISKEMIKSVQKKLMDRGFNPGTIDGIIGKSTEKALRSFQEKNSLKVTGQINSETLQYLRLPVPLQNVINETR